MDDAVEAAVLNDPREHMILDAAKPQGIPTMLHDGIEKVLLGLTSMEELGRVIELPRPLASAIPVAAPTTETPAADDDFLKHVV